MNDQFLQFQSRTSFTTYIRTFQNRKPIFHFIKLKNLHCLPIYLQSFLIIPHFLMYFPNLMHNFPTANTLQSLLRLINLQSLRQILQTLLPLLKLIINHSQILINLRSLYMITPQNPNTTNQTIIQKLNSINKILLFYIITSHNTLYPRMQRMVAPPMILKRLNAIIICFQSFMSLLFLTRSTSLHYTRKRFYRFSMIRRKLL